MKIKAMLLTGFFLLGLVLIAPQSAVSQDTLWADTTIDRINQTQSIIQVRLSDIGGQFSKKLFNIDHNRQEAQLAILLTALSLDKSVRIAFHDGNPATIILVGVTK